MVRFSPHSTAIIFSLLLPFALIICNLGILCETLNKASHCNENEKQILLNFKQGVTDPSGMLSTWSSTTEDNCCEWRGVKCGNDNITGTGSRVKKLNLSCSTDDFIYGINKNKSHCLTGELHLSSLLQLQFLTHLNFSNNNFNTIVIVDDEKKQNNSANTSSNLVYLNLSQNENLMIDDDDLRWLLTLNSLLDLNLNFIDLHKLNDQWLQMLTMLPSLFKLHLKNCNLENASPSSSLANNFTSTSSSSLGYLDLSYNNFFSELPNWLFNLTGLYHINLRWNRFHGEIPSALLNLKSSLYSLDLENNMLSGTLPNWFGQFENLNYLLLSSNLFTGPIPISLGNISYLRVLDVASNNLNGSLPESFGNLSNLKEISVVGNPNLTGVVSHSNFVNLPQLKRLFLGSPSFIFDFNPLWIPPFQLKILVLRYVNLKLVPWIYTQKSLSILEIDNSSFAHESPSKFWSWIVDIRSISLTDNSMNWDMSNVSLNSKAIWMIRNGLKGGLPQLTSNVQILQLRENNLSGQLFPLLCHNMDMNGESSNNNLQYLDISNNLLSDFLTHCWINWKSLVHINLGKNNLKGMIPHSLGALSNLLSLHLDNNKLHGKIPLSLKNCQDLMILNLGENEFSGAIPSWMGQNMRALQLRSNEFSGDIPIHICQLSSLVVLDVADNKLSGTIPHCLNNITAMILSDGELNSVIDKYGVFLDAINGVMSFSLPLLTKGKELEYKKYMRVMDFSSNNLFGNIPIQVFKLNGLQSLNLSWNQLSGIIADEIGNLKQLESLDFSNNKLSGEIPQSMSALSFLGALNLSFNHFHGQIPLGTQLQGFTALSYIGNHELCGTPLKKNCNYDVEKSMEKDDEEQSKFLMSSVYMGMGVGFAISFWMVCGSLFFIRAWRHAYFMFLYHIKDQLYVKMMMVSKTALLHSKSG